MKHHSYCLSYLILTKINITKKVQKIFLKKLNVKNVYDRIARLIRWHGVKKRAHCDCIEIKHIVKQNSTLTQLHKTKNEMVATHL